MHCEGLTIQVQEINPMRDHNKPNLLISERRYKILDMLNFEGQKFAIG